MGNEEAANNDAFPRKHLLQKIKSKLKWQEHEISKLRKLIKCLGEGGKLEYKAFCFESCCTDHPIGAICNSEDEAKEELMTTCKHPQKIIVYLVVGGQLVEISTDILWDFMIE